MRQESGGIFSIANESIDFSNGIFFKELTMLYGELRKDSNKNKMLDSEINLNISACIKHNTGLDILMDINENGHGPAIEIPEVNRNNPLVTNLEREYWHSAVGLQAIRDAGGVVKGTVNSKTGKVSGVFTLFKSTMYMPTSLLQDKKFSDEEIAAITLHEVGHVFNYCEYISRTITTNQVLSAMSKELDKTSDLKEREVIFTNVKHALKLKNLDVKKLSESKNKTAVELVVVTNVRLDAKSELGSDLYDMNSWEYLCDQFATRHGAGRHIVTSLDKLTKGSFNISYRGSFAYTFMESVKIVLLICAIGVGVGTFGGGIGAMKFLFSIPLTFFVALADFDTPTQVYDTPEARYNRVRGQLVEYLKDKKLSKEKSASINEDINVIDNILKDVVDRRQWLSALADAVVPFCRKNYNQEQLQKDLENFALNDIFIQSAKLRQLATA